MARRSPSDARAQSGDNCPLLAITARFLIWATRNARREETAAVAAPERPAGSPAANCG